MTEESETAIQQLGGYDDVREYLTGYHHRKCPLCGETWWESRYNRCPECEHEEAFREIAPKYAEKWALYSDIKNGAWYWQTLEAMATELEHELNYDVNPLTCKDYILEALPEDHPDHETIEDRRERLHAD